MRVPLAEWRRRQLSTTPASDERGRVFPELQGLFLADRSMLFERPDCNWFVKRVVEFPILAIVLDDNMQAVAELTVVPQPHLAKINIQVVELIALESLFDSWIGQRMVVSLASDISLHAIARAAANAHDRVVSLKSLWGTVANEVLQATFDRTNDLRRCNVWLGTGKKLTDVRFGLPLFQ